MTAPQRRGLLAAADAEVRHWKGCRSLVKDVDATVYRAGRTVLTSDRALLKWLCRPARSLDGGTPINVLRTAAGRRRIAAVLTALAHGSLP